jgi:hypothetical protein
MIREPGFGGTVAGQERIVGGRESAIVAAVQFEIRVAGAVPASLLNELGNVRVLTQSVKTVLRGAVPDQAALMAIINRLQGLGIELCGLRQL